MSMFLVFDGCDNMRKVGTMFKFWVNIKLTVNALNAYNIVDYTYFTKLSLFHGLNKLYVIQDWRVWLFKNFTFSYYKIVDFWTSSSSFTKKGVVLKLFLLSNKNILLNLIQM